MSENFKMRAKLLSNAFLIPYVLAANVSQFPWLDSPQAEHPIAHPTILARPETPGSPKQDLRAASRSLIIQIPIAPVSPPPRRGQGLVGRLAVIIPWVPHSSPRRGTTEKRSVFSGHLLAGAGRERGTRVGQRLMPAGRRPASSTPLD